jgi:hypothetical protein
LVDEDYGSYDECNAGITRETAQSINSGAFTAIDFTAVTGSRSSWSDVANDYIEVAVPGLYIVIIYVVWASNSTGQRIIRPDFTNGATTQAAGQTQRQAIFNSRDMATTLADFAAAGRVGASVFQDSGGALNMTNCRLVVAKVGF